MDSFLSIQKKFVNTIDNARLSNRLSHALLIEGNNKALLDHAVNYIAMSLMCPEIKVCHECEHCQRVINKQNSDIIEFDLSDTNLKKENILAIQNRFSHTPLEQTNKQIYIIKYIENANSISLNTLLKFIEEPHPSVYAIFTTQNSSKVLETIVSRTNLYRIKPANKEDVINYFKSRYLINDVEFISKITSDESVFEEIINSNVFTLYKNSLNRIYNSLGSENFYIDFYEMAKDLDKDEISILLELMYVSFIDCSNLSLLDVSDKVLEKLRKLNNLEVCLDILITSRLKLKSNMNKALLIDEIGLEIEATCNEYC